MKSDLFSTNLTMLPDGEDYFLIAKIRIPWNGKKPYLPLRFTGMPQIEYQGESSDHRFGMNPEWLKKLVTQVIAQHTTIYEWREVSLQFTVSLQGELVFNGSGRDVDLAQYRNPYAEGLYFEVGKLVVSGASSELFRWGGGAVDMTDELGQRVAVSHQIVKAWLQKQPPGFRIDRVTP